MCNRHEITTDLKAGIATWDIEEACPNFGAPSHIQRASACVLGDRAPGQRRTVAMPAGGAEEKRIHVIDDLQANYLRIEGRVIASTGFAETRPPPLSA